MMRQRHTNSSATLERENESNLQENDQSYSAIQISRPGGYDVLQKVSLPGEGALGANIEGVSKQDMVVVSTSFVGINYADICIRWGLYESAKKFVGWPIVPGFEFSGTVTEIGKAVTGINIGDHVFGMTMFGGYSTSIQVPQHQVYPLPCQFNLQEGAAFLTVALTAWYAMFKQYQPQPGDTVMIHSVAGTLRMYSFHCII